MSQISPLPPVGPGGVRIGNAEREQAASALGEHFAAGRLDAEEYDERVRQVYAAKTVGDLTPLFSDLPGPRRPAAAAAPPRKRMGATPVVTIVLLVLLLSAVWVALAHVPPFFIFPLVLLVIIRHRHRRHAWRY